jgi:hypothetical protein
MLFKGLLGPSLSLSSSLLLFSLLLNFLLNESLLLHFSFSFLFFLSHLLFQSVLLGEFLLLFRKLNVQFGIKKKMLFQDNVEEIFAGFLRSYNQIENPRLFLVSCYLVAQQAGLNDLVKQDILLLASGKLETV